LSVFVLDASTAVPWCFEESQTLYAVAVLERLAEGAEMHVPQIWPLEVTHALIKAYRRRHITRDELFEYARPCACRWILSPLRALPRSSLPLPNAIN
jgi:predicted nucleic acid-binding protein